MVILFLLFVHAIVIQIPLPSSFNNVNFNSNLCSGSDNFSITIINPTLRVTVPDDKYISHTTDSITVCPQANLDMSADYNANIDRYTGHYSWDGDINPNLLQRDGQYRAVLVYGPVGNRTNISDARVNVLFTPTTQVLPSSYTANTNTILTLNITFNFKPETNLVYNNDRLCIRNRYTSKPITTLNHNLRIYVISNLNISASIEKIAGPTADGDYFWYTIKITNTGIIPFKVTNIRPDRGSIISIQPNILNQVINLSQYVEFRVKTTQETGVLYFDLSSDRQYCGTTITSTLQLGLNPSFRCTINPNPIWILNQSGASNSTFIYCGGSSCDNVIFSPISELSILRTGDRIDVTLNSVVNRPNDVVRINATRGSNRYSCELNISYYANNSTLQCTINPNPVNMVNGTGSSATVQVSCGGQSCQSMNFTGVPSYLRLQLLYSNILIQMIGTASNSMDTISIAASYQNNNYRCNLIITYSNLTNPCRSRI